MMPTSAGYGSFVQRTCIAESLTASATMMFLQLGVFEAQATSMARHDLGIRSPVRRSELVGHPAGDGLRWLSTNAADGVRQIVDAVEHHLSGICWTVGGVRTGLPDVNDISSIRLCNKVFNKGESKK